MSSPTLWAFGGGKGGVGKSLVCAAVAAEIARRGRRVVVLDADLGAANLHTLLGILHPARTLGDFFADRQTDLEPYCVPTDVEGLRLISGAAAILRAAHPRPADRRRLVEGMLGLDADVLLIDLGAGTHYNTLDFFNLAGHRLLVTSAEPTSIQNAYAFVKAAIFRRLELGLARHEWVQGVLDRAIQPRGDDRIDSMAHLLTVLERRDPAVADEARALVAEMEPRLVVNMADARAQRRVSGALAVVCQRYLDLRPADAGWLPDDPAARRAVRRMRPVLKEAPDGPLAGAVRALVGRIESREPRPRPDLLIEPDAMPAPRRALVSPPNDAGDTVPAMAPYPGIRLSPPGTAERAVVRGPRPNPTPPDGVLSGSGSGSTAGLAAQAGGDPRESPQTLARLHAVADEPSPFGFVDDEDDPPALDPTPFDFAGDLADALAPSERASVLRATSTPSVALEAPTYVASSPVSKSMFDDRLESIGALESIELEMLDPPLGPIDDPLDDALVPMPLPGPSPLELATGGPFRAVGGVGGLGLGRAPATGEAWDALVESPAARRLEELEPVGSVDEVDSGLDVSLSVFDDVVEDVVAEVDPTATPMPPRSTGSARSTESDADPGWDVLDGGPDPDGADTDVVDADISDDLDGLPSLHGFGSLDALGAPDGADGIGPMGDPDASDDLGSLGFEDASGDRDPASVSSVWDDAGGSGTTEAALPSDLAEAFGDVLSDVLSDDVSTGAEAGSIDAAGIESGDGAPVEWADSAASPDVDPGPPGGSGALHDAHDVGDRGDAHDPSDLDGLVDLGGTHGPDVFEPRDADHAADSFHDRRDLDGSSGLEAFDVPAGARASVSAPPADLGTVLDGLDALGGLLDAESSDNVGVFDVQAPGPLPEPGTSSKDPDPAGAAHGASAMQAPAQSPPTRPAEAPPDNIREALGRAGVRGVDPASAGLPRASSARWTGERLPGFTRGMLDALAARDEAPPATAPDPWQDAPWDDAPWDADPWGGAHLADRLRGRGVQGAALAAPADTVATDEPLSDPPAHPVLGFAEALETPDGRLHLQTLDLAPAAARIVQTVYRDGAVVARHGSAYARFLGGEPETITRHVEETHERARLALLQGGLSGLGWPDPGRRAAGRSVR